MKNIYDTKEYDRRKREKAVKETGFSRSTVQRYGKNTLAELKKRWKCTKCQTEENLTIHHKDRNGINKARNGEKMNNSIENLEVICRSCHGRMHRKDRK